MSKQLDASDRITVPIHYKKILDIKIFTLMDLVALMARQPWPRISAIFTIAARDSMIIDYMPISKLGWSNFLLAIFGIEMFGLFNACVYKRGALKRE